MKKILNDKSGSVLPLVLSIFILVSTFSFILFNTVFTLVLTTNRAIEASENEFQAINSIKVLANIINNDPAVLENAGVIAELLNLTYTRTNGTFEFVYEVSDTREYFVTVVTDGTFNFPGQSNPGFPGEQNPGGNFPPPFQPKPITEAIVSDGQFRQKE